MMSPASIGARARLQIGDMAEYMPAQLAVAIELQRGD
jgi:hypothetical protein